MDIGHVLFRPNGRIGQQDFWIGVLIIIGAHILSPLLGPLQIVAWLGLVWVGFAVYGKRLHDAGRSAWLHVLPWAIWLGLMIVAAVFLAGAGVFAIIMGTNGGDPSASDIMGLVAAGGMGLALTGLSYVIWLVYTIWVGLLPGDTSENAYGSPPTGDAATAATASAASGSAGAPLEGEITRADPPGDASKS